MLKGQNCVFLFHFVFAESFIISKHFLDSHVHKNASKHWYKYIVAFSCSHFQKVFFRNKEKVIGDTVHHFHNILREAGLFKNTQSAAGGDVEWMTLSPVPFCLQHEPVARVIFPGWVCLYC